MRLFVRLITLVAAAAVLLGMSVLALDEWQPIRGSPDQVSRRFLAGMPPASTPEAAEGRRLVGELGCLRCHTTDLAGGRLVEGPFGHVKTANLTPDVTGLHRATIDTLLNALRKGIDDDGAPLPNRAMPWDLIGHLSDAEMRSILAYLQAVPGITRGNARLFPGGTAAGEIRMPLTLPPE